MDMQCRSGCRGRVWGSALYIWAPAAMQQLSSPGRACSLEAPRPLQNLDPPRGLGCSVTFRSPVWEGSRRTGLPNRH